MNFPKIFKRPPQKTEAAPIVDPGLCAQVMVPERPLRCDVIFESTLGAHYPNGTWKGLVNDVEHIAMKAGTRTPIVLPHGYYTVVPRDGRPIQLRREPFSQKEHGELLQKQLGI